MKVKESNCNYSKVGANRTTLHHCYPLTLYEAPCYLFLCKICVFYPLIFFSLVFVLFSCLDLEMAEFSLQDVVATAVSQVLVASQAKGIRITYDLSDRLMTEKVYGDSLRLQQIIADFLLVSVKYSPSGGHVEIAPKLIKDRLGETVHLVHLELRYSYERFNISLVFEHFN